MKLNLYKLFSEDGKKNYYCISKLKPNYVVNLFVCYYNHKPELKHSYYEIIKVPHNIELIEEFEDRSIAKELMNKMIKDDPNCINVQGEDKPDEPDKPKKQIKAKEPKKEKKQKESNKEKKIKMRKTDDPEYNKKYYEKNKDKLKGYYNDHLEKCREYNKKRYYETKQKLQRLKELENQLNNNV